MVISGCDSDGRKWKKAQERNTAQSYEEYLSKYPKGKYIDKAKNQYFKLHWPPVPAMDQEVLMSANYEMSFSGGQGEGWDYAYTDSSKSQQIGWGSLCTSGDTMLKCNIFEITSAENGYTENQYEVVYYDNSRTLIRLDKGKKDKLLILNRGLDSSGFHLTGTAAFTGTKVRYCDRVYEIRDDGWYIGSELIHPFFQK